MLASRKASRIVTRYQTDLTGTEWRVIAPHLPKPCTTGRPRAWPIDRQWDLSDAGGLPVAAGAGRPAAVGDDLPLVRRLARRRAL